MVVDFHTHIFPDAIANKTISMLESKSGNIASTDGTLNGLIKSMNESKVDLSVILPVVTKPEQFESINLFAKSVNEKYNGRLISFGGIHPDSDNYKEELNTVKNLGIKGIKIHPDYQGVMIDDIRYKRIIEYASELGLIIVTHAGIDIGIPEPVHCPPDKMRKVLDEIKPSKMVLAHYGGWKQWEEVYEYLAGENVYFDTAFTLGYVSEDNFKRILDKHGADKILFATDAPWCSMKESIEILKSYNLDKTTEEKILSSNAKRLLGI
jgi:predicted TIM-barrel fold metal-dependent hydrolase